MSFRSRRQSPRFQFLTKSRRHALDAAIRQAGSNLAVAGSLTLLLLLWVAYRWIWQPAWFGNLAPNWIELFDLIEFGGTITVLFVWALYIWRLRARRQSAIAGNEPVMMRPTIEMLYGLSPKAFEHYVAALFRRKGYKVRVRGQAGDLGVDLEISDPVDGKDAIVQCKRYRNTIGPDIIRELYGTLLHERVAHAFLVTTADISDAARTWANNKPLTLIDGTLLLEISHELGLMLPATLLPQSEAAIATDQVIAS